MTAIAIDGMGLTGVLRLTWVQDNLAHVLDHSRQGALGVLGGAQPGPDGVPVEAGEGDVVDIDRLETHGDAFEHGFPTGPTGLLERLRPEGVEVFWARLGAPVDPELFLWQVVEHQGPLGARGCGLLAG